MPSSKAPVTAAIRAVASDVITPSLKERRFRKSRHHWASTDQDCVRAVTLQSSQFNVGNGGSFTLELGVAYVSLGEPEPTAHGAWFCPHRFRVPMLLGGHDHWWTYEDASDADECAAVKADFATTWCEVVLPFLDRSRDPEVVCDLFLRAGDARVLPVMEEAGRSLEGRDQDRAIASLQAALRAAEIGAFHVDRRRDGDAIEHLGRSLGIEIDEAVETSLKTHGVA